MSQLVNQLKVLCQSVFKVTFYKMFVLGGGGGGGRGGLQSVKGSFVLTQADHPNCSRDLDVK